MFINCLEIILIGSLRGDVIVMIDDHVIRTEQPSIRLHNIDNVIIEYRLNRLTIDDRTSNIQFHINSKLQLINASEGRAMSALRLRNRFEFELLSTKTMKIRSKTMELTFTPSKRALIGQFAVMSSPVIVNDDQSNYNLQFECNEMFNSSIAHQFNPSFCLLFSTRTQLCTFKLAYDKVITSHSHQYKHAYDQCITCIKHSHSHSHSHSLS